MEIIKGIPEMQQRAHATRREGISIGLVPTMGFLHEGHLSLIRAARQDCDQVVVSIFVNPLQFGPHDDFAKYPRNLDRDAQMVESAGGDILFVPEASQMYSEDHQSWVAVKGLDENLCGLFRPGHFQGVTTVVCKLFNLVKPDIAYFGQKDYQQLIIIKKMVHDLNMDIHIKGLPIVREKDGLAMSSRNIYLGKEERKAALCLYRSICRAQQMRREGVVRASVIIAEIQKIMHNEPMIRPEYVQICDPENLEALEIIEDKALLAMAVYLGETRLIDNCILSS
ncbi:MAG: pantoate--beta-alanine ligase [bacterium]